ncbi:hypothetical protein AT15_06335 [Kosmotoga arenicorallina S304]|uniref:GGDEF domain-containing protein n=1 Tax=Kosmotoga arenicorallina S304 TaxID=1453497 RepID=A0A176JTS7_9BACT|nr:type III-B CRISPR-associated protein Cas10/Cmr2 [Kosmotoga arenicorallina]OAA26690.1 hypothetical protein AT15_06335 [Kosmotoga arenicorallina S304]
MDWKKKIRALFHDPIIKAYDIPNHENISLSFLGILREHYERGEADKISSSMDRIPLPFERTKENRIMVSFDELKNFVHPLSAKKLDIFSRLPSYEEALSKIKENLLNLKKKNDTDEKLFHALWWHLPDLVDMAAFMPADTRFPNHSIIDHLDSTSALVGCIEEKTLQASLVSITIGPVQSFIAAARKTKDLWAGSYLLSTLIYAGIEYIGKNYGFDNIVFPSMRNLSFTKKSLKDWGVELLEELNTLPSPDNIASLPNRFVAIIPQKSVEKVTDEVERTIKAKWMELAKQAIEYLNQNEAVSHCDADYQLRTFPEIYSTYQPLLSPQEEDIANLMSYYHESDIGEYEKLLKSLTELGAYKPNNGALYPYSFRLLRSKVDAIKNIRYFEKFIDHARNGKTLDGDNWSGDMKAIIEVKDMADEEKVDKLSALNAVKRGFSEKRGVQFPSVEQISKNNKDFFEKIYSLKTDDFSNNYFAILIMDGDRMGKWISGSKALKMGDILSNTIIKRDGENIPLSCLLSKKFESPEDKKIVSSLLERKAIQPSYHRTISRTLNIFASLVELSVKKHGGKLVYAGGDDVLAFLPATTVLSCANEIRKMYSGIENIKLNDESKEISYEFKDEMLYVNGKPYATMMGNSATMSAGIAVVNEKFPLRAALLIAKAAEKTAKDKFDRNSFVVSIVRRSGQITKTGSKWGSKDYDVVNKISEITRFFLEGSASMRTLRKLKFSEYSKGLKLNESEFIESYVPYIIEKSEVKKEKKNEIKDFFRNILNLNSHYYASDVDKPADLLLTQQFLWRGDKR